LKDWRTIRSRELDIDPGVLCPNAALEAIAWNNPKAASDLEDVPELKSWFANEFGDEIVEVVETDRQQPPPDEKQPSRRRRR
jgi:ribonuclease D